MHSAHSSLTNTAPPSTDVLIGIGGIPMQCQFGDVWDVPVTMLHRTYSDAVSAAGAIALIIPPAASLARDPNPILAKLDGLILAGGGDIDPATYGAEQGPDTGRIDRVRDDCELALASGALARDLPVLGICRGMQLLNVARGGTLLQHLPASLGHARHLPSIGTFERHEVRLEPGSAAERLAGGTRCTVESHHHQAIDRLGEGVVVTGWDVDDGIVEAIDLPGCSFAAGVQWHPEEDPDSPVIGRFVNEVQRMVNRT